MTTDELHELVEALRPASRTIYEAMAGGELWTSTDLHGPLNRRHGDSLTKELRTLLDLGLIRYEGLRPISGRPRAYRRVAPEDVEATRHEWEYRLRKEYGQRAYKYDRGKRPGVIPRHREPGSYRPWHRVFSQVRTLALAYRKAEEMTFWDAVPDEDLETMIEIAEALRHWLDAFEVAARARFGDEKVARKVEKVRALAERGERGERENAQGRLAVLEERRRAEMNGGGP